MNAPQKQNPQNRAASNSQPATGQPEQEARPTLGQRVFIVLLYLYVLSLIWLVLSHHWLGVLPKWLDPH